MASLANFSEEEIKEIIDSALNEKTLYSYGWQYLVNANKYMKDGHYDKAVIMMAIMLVYIVRVALRRLLDNDGDYKYEVHKNLVQQVFLGKNPDFTDRLYIFGLGLLDIKLDEELIDTVQSIYSAKNALSRGDTLESTDLYQLGVKNVDNEADFFKGLLRDCEKILETFVEELEE
jgi:hypothetical protein